MTFFLFALHLEKHNYIELKDNFTANKQMQIFNIYYEKSIKVSALDERRFSRHSCEATKFCGNTGYQLRWVFLCLEF